MADEKTVVVAGATGRPGRLWCRAFEAGQQGEGSYGAAVSTAPTCGLTGVDPQRVILPL